MKNLIAANWKMNPLSLKEAKELFDAVKKGVSGVKSEVVICPPFVYLCELNGLPLGAQNVAYKEKGAFTSEVAAGMLKDLDVEYVIIGHSEVRKYLGESNELINKKVKAALDASLKPILCVGENEGEDKNQVLETQVTGALQGISSKDMKHLVIAYEPVWAIGTGNNCSPDETQRAILLIRKIVTNLYSREVADGMRILYGGSVKPENSGPYVKEAGANGFLVGGASLVAEDFIKIVESAE